MSIAIAISPKTDGSGTANANPLSTVSPSAGRSDFFTPYDKVGSIDQAIAIAIRIRERTAYG
jgi:hypothetical protein